MPPKRTSTRRTPSSSEESPAKRSWTQVGPSPKNGKSQTRTRSSTQRRLEASDHSTLPSTPVNRQHETSSPDNTDAAANAPDNTDAAANAPDNTDAAANAPDNTDAAANAPDNTDAAANAPDNTDAAANANEARFLKLEKKVDNLNDSISQIAEHLGVPKAGTRNDSADMKVQPMETSSALPSKSTSSNTSVPTSTPVLTSSGGLQAPGVPSPDDLDIKGLSMDDMSPADIVKLVYLATNVKMKRSSTRKEVAKTLAEEVEQVFLQALNEQSFNSVKTFVKNQMIKIKNETYSKESDKRHWQPKSDFMSWYLSMKHLDLDASSLDRVAACVRELCGMADIDQVEGAFMNNENLVMSKICDLMTSKQVSALWKLCSEEENPMPAFKKITPKISLDTPGMKELVFFYIIRYLELEQKFNTLYTDLMLEYIRKIRSSRHNLKKVCKILETYEILVRPVGYCLVFCVLEDRPGAEQEIENITNIFGVRLGYKVVVKRNPTKEDIEAEAKLCSESAALGIYDSFVCFLLAHGDPTDIVLSGEEKIPRKDFLQMFAREACFPKKPKLFLMGSCQGRKVLRSKRNSEKRNDSNDAKDSHVPVPKKREYERDIDTVHAESDRLVAYATLEKHAAFRNETCGSYFVTYICKQIEDLEKQDDPSINVVEVLQRANRKIHSIVFQRLGKQACYYESTLQKNFCFRLLKSTGDNGQPKP